jgi:hypothetical protein
MKTAILAAAKGYTPEQVNPWVESLKSTGFDGKVFILLYEEDIELADYFKSHNFHVMIAQERGETHMATQRFIDYAELLKSDYCKDIEIAIHTDIRDVIFQGNPADWVIENIGDKHIIATGEGVTYRHEDWNGDGIERQFGKHVYLELADKETYCSGIIAGRKDMLIRLFETIYEISYYATDQNGFVDQHFYNIALRWTFDEVTKFVPADTDWVANLGTLIALPLQNAMWSTAPRTPYNSYERIRSGTYIDNMLVDLPYMNSSNQVCTPDGIPYTIIHQYDRYQPWKEKLLSK